MTHKCGVRRSDKAPMAYIELVDSPIELGKRVEKQTKTHPSLDELREKAPSLDIYNKPVLHVSENKKTSLLGGIALLLNRARMIPVPTVQDFVTKSVVRPNLTPEFSNIPGTGQPGEAEALAAAEANVQKIKKHASEVLARRKVERKDEVKRLRAQIGFRKHKQAGGKKGEEGKKGVEGEKVEAKKGGEGNNNNNNKNNNAAKKDEKQKTKA